MKKEENYILKFIMLSLSIFALVFLMLTPYFTSSFSDLRQKKIIEENYQRLLKEKQKIYLMGKFDPAQREDFSPVPEELNIGGYKMYLRKETLRAFLKMQNAAKKDEIDLKIASATRNFDYQKNLWNNKWSGATVVDGKDLSKDIFDEQERFEKILEYSAAPGTSRHHWGTDIDINNANFLYFNSEKGKKEYEWLVKNAPLFGFCQTYNLKDSARGTGYNEEKWHWSYLPLSRTFIQEYKNLIKDEDIKGFLGDKYVPALNLINNYILAINPDCL